MYPLLDIMWSMFVFFGLIMFFWALIKVFGDLFRRHDIGGWGKTGWTLFVIFLPLIGAFTYLIAQGRAMADRDLQQARTYQQQTDEYIRSVAAGNGHTAGHSSIDEIARAKQLLDNGAINKDEYEQVKKHALV